MNYLKLVVNSIMLSPRLKRGEINKSLLRRITIIAIISCLISINIAFTGTSPDTNTTADITYWINNTATEEELRNFDNFLEGLRAQNNPNLVVNQETYIPEQRFGWESLGIFVVASILGYLFIKHGMTALDMFREFLGELVTNSLELLRVSVTRKVTLILEDPDIADQVLRYYQQNRR